MVRLSSLPSMAPAKPRSAGGASSREIGGPTTRSIRSTAVFTSAACTGDATKHVTQKNDKQSDRIALPNDLPISPDTPSEMETKSAVRCGKTDT